MVRISFSSLNCLGLGSSFKRNALFNRFKKMDIIFLQETYVMDNKVDGWMLDWGGKYCYSPGTTKSNGLMILYKENLFQSTEFVFYKNQRILALRGRIEDEDYFFINVYGPSNGSSEDRKKFMSDLYYVCSRCTTNNVFIGGDFNLMMDNELDNVAGKDHDPREIEHLVNWVIRQELVDCWRELHQGEKDFTWARYNPVFIARRLDYFLIKNDLLPYLKSAKHFIIAGTDHKMVSCILDTDDSERGPSYWKLNTSLLEDENYLHLMNKEIEEFKCLSFQDPVDRLESLKILVKSKSIEFSTNKKAQETRKIRQLHKDLNFLNEKVRNDSSNTDLTNRLLHIKKELEIFEMNKARGARKRAKIVEIEKNEKNTAYFLGVEKSRGVHNCINRLNVNEREITDQSSILKELKKHFENIGRRDQTLSRDNLTGIQEYLNNSPTNKISEIERNHLERELNIQEIGKALFHLNNDSSPGLDGIPANWYKVFYSKIKVILFEALSKSIEEGSLGLSQRLGVVTLVHKGIDLSKEQIKNYRPITVTNSDYKILSKCIALRLQSVLEQIINVNQSGFMRGRNISDHIRIIDDIINLSHKFDTPGIIVSLDFEKAFDSLSKNSILDTLKFFNFGENFIRMVSTLLNGSESCIQNNGFLSSFFQTERGVRQGCPASPLFFILVCEILAIKIRASDNIKGLSFVKNEVKTEEAKILQYADDATLLVESEEDLNNAIKITEEFYLISGLKLNKSKSVALPIGSLKDMVNANTSNNIQWKKKGELIKILGIFFNSIEEASDIEYNWSKKIERIRSLSVKLHRRKVTLWGRILLCKTFLLSQIAFHIQSLSMPDKFIKELERICFSFIWQSNKNSNVSVEKIKRSVMCLAKEKGGASMIKSCTQQKLFLIKWILKAGFAKSNLLINASKIPDLYFEYYGGINCFLSFNCVVKEITFPTLIPRFWKDAIKAWLTLKHNIKIMSEKEHNIANQLFSVSEINVPIFNNHYCKYRNQLLFNRHMISHGYNYVHDLVDMDNNFTSITGFPSTLRKLPDFMFIYSTIKTAVLNATNKKQCKADRLDGYKIWTLNNSKLREILEFNTTESINICGKNFWERKFSQDNIFEKYIFSLSHIKEIKIKVMLFKIFHNIHHTRILLKKWGEVEDDHCDCGERDFIEHSFSDCPLLIPLWNRVSSEIHSITNKRLHLSSVIKIFGLSKSDAKNLELDPWETSLINNILAVAKFSINKTKTSASLNFLTVFEFEWEIRKEIMLPAEIENE